jgi:hypothetical protein
VLHNIDRVKAIGNALRNENAINTNAFHFTIKKEYFFFLL